VLNRFNSIFEKNLPKVRPLVRTKLNKMKNKTQRRIHPSINISFLIIFVSYFSAKILSGGMRQPTINQMREESFIEEKSRKSKCFNMREIMCCPSSSYVKQNLVVVFSTGFKNFLRISSQLGVLFKTLSCEMV
jgi:hypothetical protein